MDPLSDVLACACVQGHAQRSYSAIAELLRKKLSRPVELSYGESIPDLLKLHDGPFDIIIGKNSVVLYDAARAKLPVRPIAALTDPSGTAKLTGLFVVRADDPAKTIANLKNHRILLGPEYETEKSSAAIAALRQNGVELPAQTDRAQSCNEAALAVVENDADAAVISSYALPLLEGCDTIDKGSLRIIGTTGPVDFITVFATENITPNEETAMVSALLGAKANKTLLKKIESRSGFIMVSPGWTDFRGPNRDATVVELPARLPDSPNILWQKQLTGVGPSGITATNQYVIVADKSADKTTDIFRCLDALTGTELWTLQYPTPKEMDYSNSPRATPVIRGGLVYTLGAFGDLNCVDINTGQPFWKINIIEAFAAELPTWGTCSTPLVIGKKIVVNPGAKDASLVALDRFTGEVIWKTPGEPAAYASFIVGTFGGKRQIVGYDSISVGGWDPETGKRIWTLSPEAEGDFNVPTPLDIDGKLLLTTENNATRLYEFDNNGRINPVPIAQNDDLYPDTLTPIAAGSLLFGATDDLFCLDLNDKLKTRWSQKDDAFYDYLSFITDGTRLLIISVEGELILIPADPAAFTPISRLKLFEKNSEVWSHPALVANRLYVRSQNKIICLPLTE